MTTIRVTSRNAAGVAVPGARVVVRLVAGPRPTDPGYFLTGDYSITSESHTVTGSTGLKVLTLPPTDGISPDGCFYEIATVTGTNVAKRTIIVPDSGTYDWGDPAIQVITPVPPEWEPIVGDGLARQLDVEPGETTVIGSTDGIVDYDALRVLPGAGRASIQLPHDPDEGQAVVIFAAMGAGDRLGPIVRYFSGVPAITDDLTEPLGTFTTARGNLDFSGAAAVTVTWRYVDPDGDETLFPVTIDEAYTPDLDGFFALLADISAPVSAVATAVAVDAYQLRTIAGGPLVRLEMLDPGNDLGLSALGSTDGTEGLVGLSGGFADGTDGRYAWGDNEDPAKQYLEAYWDGTAWMAVTIAQAALVATYYPADSADWTGTDPATTAEALDRIAAALGPIA
jgi:hypothetical protein